MTRRPDDGDPLAPVRCLGCGAVNADWRRLGAGAIFASSAIVAGWALLLWWSIGTSLWWLLLPFLGASGLAAAACDRIYTRFGVPECRLCGDQRTESVEWYCEVISSTASGTTVLV